MTSEPTLTPLDEFNHTHRKLHELPTYPLNNGIACPKCGKEMQDTDGGVLLSYPPQKNINCPACGHRDYRIT